jgi:predicted O-linked N-acetylglucosamine transferase (SPINDLY family)
MAQRPVAPPPPPSNDEVGSKLVIADRLATEGKVDEAIEVLSQLLLRFPTRTDILLCAGRILIQADRLEEAVDVLTVLKVHLPANMEVRRVLANVLLRMRKFDPAESELKEVTGADPRDVEAWIALSKLYDQTGRTEQAVEAVRHALDVDPSSLDTTSLALGLLSRSGKDGEVLELLEKVPPEISGAPDIRFLEAMLMPAIPDSMNHILERRQHLAETLGSLRESGQRFRSVERPISVTSFYLGYHGLEDRELLEEIAQTVLQLAPGLDYVSPRLKRKPVAARKLKVGFLSSNMRVHSVGRVLNRFLKELDRERFEVLLFELPGKFEAGQEIARGFADRTIAMPGSLSPARRAVELENVDILMIPDFVMDPFTDMLAYGRLAPVQCSTWGHPGTSGRKSIDYWVSCDDWEPAGNERLYTEKLVRLSAPPMIATRLDVPDPITPREELGLPEGRLYGCPQSLYKLHPEFDAFIGEILRRDPAARMVLVGGLQPRWVEAFKARVGANYPDVVERLVFTRHLSTSDYLSLLSYCEVSLDPIHFGGANTTMEAFTMGVPVVTWPGGQLRNRQTLSFYNMMKFPDLIVDSQESYVDLVLRIGNDPGYRAELSKIVRDRCHVLFDTVQVTRELESFFLSAAAEAIG